MVRIAACSILFMFVATAHTACGNQLYWTSFGEEVYRANTDGTNRELLFTQDLNYASQDIEVDRLSGKMYWSINLGAQPGNYIKRANLDGSDQEDLIETQTRDLTLDVVHQEMYWLDVTTGYDLKKSSFDGSNIQSIIPDSLDLRLSEAHSLHIAGSKLYIATNNSSTARLWEMNLDGSGVRRVVSTFERWSIFGIQVDPQAGRAYFSQYAPGVIYSVNLDGSDLTTLLDVSVPIDNKGLGRLALNRSQGTLYFAHDGDIQAISVTGENRRIVIPQVTASVQGLAYVPEPASIAMLGSGLGCLGLFYLKRRR